MFSEHQFQSSPCKVPGDNGSYYLACVQIEVAEHWDTARTGAWDLLTGVTLKYHDTRMSLPSGFVSNLMSCPMQLLSVQQRQTASDCHAKSKLVKTPGQSYRLWA